MPSSQLLADPPAAFDAAAPSSPVEALLVAAVEGCNVAIAHCVRSGGRRAEPVRLGRLVDAVELGQTAAGLDDRGSPLLRPQLAVCRAAFARVAADCESWTEDPILSYCGQVCSSAAAGLA